MSASHQCTQIRTVTWPLSPFCKRLHTRTYTSLPYTTYTDTYTLIGTHPERCCSPWSSGSWASPPPTRPNRRTSLDHCLLRGGVLCCGGAMNRIDAWMDGCLFVLVWCCVGGGGGVDGWIDGWLLCCCSWSVCVGHQQRSNIINTNIPPTKMHTDTHKHTHTYIRKAYLNFSRRTTPSRPTTRACSIHGILHTHTTTYPTLPYFTYPTLPTLPYKPKRTQRIPEFLVQHHAAPSHHSCLLHGVLDLKPC